MGRWWISPGDARRFLSGSSLLALSALSGLFSLDAGQSLLLRWGVVSWKAGNQASRAEQREAAVPSCLAAVPDSSPAFKDARRDLDFL